MPQLYRPYKIKEKLMTFMSSILIQKLPDLNENLTHVFSDDKGKKQSTDGTNKGNDFNPSNLSTIHIGDKI